MEVVVIEEQSVVFLSLELKYGIFFLLLIIVVKVVKVIKVIVVMGAGREWEGRQRQGPIRTGWGGYYHVSGMRRRRP